MASSAVNVYTCGADCSTRLPTVIALSFRTDRARSSLIRVSTVFYSICTILTKYPLGLASLFEF